MFLIIVGVIKVAATWGLGHWLGPYSGAEHG